MRCDLAVKCLVIWLNEWFGCLLYILFQSDILCKVL